MRACGCKCNFDYTLTYDGSKTRCECNGNTTGMCMLKPCIIDIVIAMWAVYNHWTGLVDWTGGLDWWTGLVD